MGKQSDSKKEQIDRLCLLALEKDVLNIINVSNENRPMSPYQRKFIEKYCGVVDKHEVLDALAVLRDAVCGDCEKIVETLIENLKCQQN